MTLPISSQLVSSTLASIDIDASDYRGRTALHRAISAGSNGAVVALLAAGASPHVRDSNGWTSLHIAALAKNLFLTAILLDAGANINATGKRGESPAFLARPSWYSKPSDAGTLKLLCLRGADIDIKNEEGNSLRSWAEQNSRKSARDHILRILHSNVLTSLGAFEVSLEPNRVTTAFREAPLGVCQAIAEVLTPDRIYTRDAKGLTPVEVACEQDLYWVALYLAKKGNPSLKPKQGRIVPYHILQREKAQRKKGYSPLHVAVHCGRFEDIPALIEAGVDSEVVDEHGNTPLHLAAKLGGVQAIVALLEGGANIEARNDFRKRTPLHVAALSGQFGAIRLLLQAGADTEARDWLGNTPLHLAAGAKSSRGVSLLAEKKVIDARNKYEETPLHLGAKSGCGAVISHLIESGAPLDVADKYGKTPFLQAVHSGKEEAVSCFIDAGCDVNGGYTLPEAIVGEGNKIEYRDCLVSYLHEAARLGFCGIISLLIREGANKNAHGLYGNTPLHTAAFMGGVRAIDTLLREGAEPTITSHCSKSTPLHIAALWSPSAGADKLLEAGANPNATDASGSAPLHLAFRHRNREVAKVLCQRRGAVGLKNAKGESFRSLVESMKSSELKAEFSRWLPWREPQSLDRKVFEFLRGYGFFPKTILGTQWD
ncbi:MAG: Phosphocholine transferase AnkX [Chlamydiae bacterium]|nr:Phosphocholine transferase AnkX [Chlamydiota bacterium]